MSIKGVEFGSHHYPIESELSFPELEQKIYQECQNKKEGLKKTLLEEANLLADQKTYSEVESYGQAIRMIVDKCNTVESELLANVGKDHTKTSIINYAWQETQAELFSPFHFLKTLMNTLRKQPI